MTMKLLQAIGIGTLVLLTSCSKWLDIQPESEIEKDILFTTEEGFKEALLGIYSRGSQADLYGKELTVGSVEVLAQNYNIAVQDKDHYVPTQRFRYHDADFIERKDAIWQGLYHGVVNSNLILQEIDQKQQLFRGDNYRLIKGEALALRAYFHFDALRLFAPAPVVSMDAPGVPYVTVYGNKTTAMSSVGAVLDSVVRDLEAAKELLEIDPIRQASYIIGYPSVTDSLENTELQDADLFLQNRRHRLNYYAVCGLLARVHLYAGHKEEALHYAQLVIDADKFPWTNTSDILQVEQDKKDRILYKELLFAWYIPNMANHYNNEWFMDSRDKVFLERDEVNEIYGAAGEWATDVRYTPWFGTSSSGSGSESFAPILKYRRNTFSDAFEANLHYLVAPGIRLSEMYYIAAECTYDSKPTEALALLDEVRNHRGIAGILTVADKAGFQKALLEEYRKEMYAEGQLFYAYKRLNADIDGLHGEIIPANQEIFVLPLPNDEIEYGQR